MQNQSLGATGISQRISTGNQMSVYIDDQVNTAAPDQAK